MRYRILGKTGLRVSEIGFGSWGISGMDWGATDDEVSIRAIQQAIDLGVNFIDTADVYGNGHSEELVARALKGRREGIIVATKAGNDFYQRERKSGDYAVPNFDPEYLAFAVEQSLRRLQTDRLDILQLHGPSLELIRQGDCIEALERLKREGKIRFGGVSYRSFKDDEGVASIETGRIDVLQVRYNLLEQEPAKQVLPLAKKHNVGIIVRIPILFGVLTGKFTRETRFPPEDHRSRHLQGELLARYIDQFEKLGFLKEGKKDTWAQIALRFILSHHAVSTVIPGGKTPQQVSDNCAASDLGPLPKSDLERIQSLYERDFA
jgi:aryl-alcohol dehydrogenase-like predicted oxidoreductase